MAMLTKGMSYRRQGSSGLIWAENMVLTEDGAFPKRHQNDNGFSRDPARMTEVPDLATGASPGMARSKSVGSTTSSVSVVAPRRAQKSSFSVLKWLKKAFTRRRR
eukprot:c21322_g1_i1 orf=111-425(+)